MDMAPFGYLAVMILSPLLGALALQFAYPDIMLRSKTKRWALYVAFGLLTYAFSAAVALSGLVVAAYSPIGKSPIFFESEGNLLFMIGLFFFTLIMATSLVNIIAERSSPSNLVGIPRSMMASAKNSPLRKSNPKVQKIKELTKEIGEEIGHDADVDGLISRINDSVKRERETRSKVITEVARKVMIADLGQNEDKLMGIPPGQESKELSEIIPPAQTTDIAPVRISTKKPAKEEKKAEQVKTPTKNTITREKLRMLLNSPGVRDELKAEIEKSQNERKSLIGELEQKVKEKHLEDEKQEKLSGLIGELKGSISKEEQNKGQISEIASGLKSLTSSSSESTTGDIQEAIGSGDFDSSDNIELFEDDLSFGSLGIGTGPEGDMGGVGEFDDLATDFGNLDENSFDLETDGAMFETENRTDSGCPNCGKKGTTLVYCSSCGKPFCSKCAESVQGEEKFVKYKCPHCHAEFALSKPKNT